MGRPLLDWLIPEKRMTREKQLAKLAHRADEQAVLAERKRRFHELQDGYRFISYEIGENHLIIRVLRFKILTIPYSRIVEIEVLPPIFPRRFLQCNLRSGLPTACRIEKSRGWCRHVLVSPREPKILLNAFHAFRSRATAISEMDKNARLPNFLRPHGDLKQKD